MAFAERHSYQSKEYKRSFQEEERGSAKFFDLEEEKRQKQAREERERILEARKTEQLVEPEDYHTGKILTQKEKDLVEARSLLDRRLEMASETISQEEGGTIGRDLERVRTEIYKVENQYKKYRWNPFAWKKCRRLREQIIGLQGKALKREVAYAQVSLSVSREQAQEGVLQKYKNSLDSTTSYSVRKVLEQQIRLLENQINEEKRYKELQEQEQQTQGNQEQAPSREEFLILKETADLEQRLQQEKEMLKQSKNATERAEIQKKINWNYNRVLELRRRQIELHSKLSEQKIAS